MPVEIKELQIRVTVNQPAGEAQNNAAAGGGAGEKEEKEAIIRQCIEQVMDLLNQKKER